MNFGFSTILIDASRVISAFFLGFMLADVLNARKRGIKRTWQLWSLAGLAANAIAAWTSGLLVIQDTFLGLMLSCFAVMVIDMRRGAKTSNRSLEEQIQRVEEDLARLGYRVVDVRVVSHSDEESEDVKE